MKNSYHLDVACTDEEFECDSGNCISKAAYCDGYVDCLDGTDEEGCSLPQGLLDTSLVEFLMGSQFFIYLLYVVLLLSPQLHTHPHQHLKNVVHPRPVAATDSALSNRSSATDSKSAWTDPTRRTASRARATASCKKT